MKFAFDVGGVLIDKDTHLFIDDAITSFILVIQKFRKENVFIISKTGETYKQQTLDIFDKNNFWTKTNFLRENLYFVEEYADKAILCKRLSIDYMVDDNTKVLKFIEKPTIPIWINIENKPNLHNIENLIEIRKWTSFRKKMQSIMYQ